ncbi:MAG: hypothetical protein K0U52_10470 [Gammaproteobacteria bacterium]|jgi:hypothetical protein|nr:hypothetical protein [Gammaproteobacteria bacterium]
MARKKTTRRSYGRKTRSKTTRRAIRRPAKRSPARRAAARKSPAKRRSVRRNPSIIANPTVQAVGLAGAGFIAGQVVSKAALGNPESADAGLVVKAANALTFKDSEGKVVVPAQVTLGIAFALLGLGMGYKVGNAKIRTRMLAFGLGMFISPAASYFQSMRQESGMDRLQSVRRIKTLRAPKAQTSFTASSRAVASSYAQ